ncbi:MAG TPA: hypothetical protein VJS44_16740 [Pyrinomonadaceae bacterium]|nr:hypothetical protein [Pyrinomonadaceae bacterium]
MKKCPTCNKTYSDDSMSFCLEDGSPLLSVGGEQPPAGSGSFDPNLTIPFTPPRDTAGQGTGPASGSQWGSQQGGPASGQFGGQPSGYGQQPGQYGQQGGGQYGGQASGQFPPPPQQPSQYTPTPGWGGPQPPPPYTGGPKKKSALPWIIGAISLLVVLGVGAAVVIGILASKGSNTNRNNSNNSNQTANRTNRNGSTNNSNNSNQTANNTNSTTSGKPSASDDFSSEAWWTGTAEVGSAEYSNSEYHLRATPTGYMVIYGPDAFRTENATTRVTARSVSSSPDGGYGLAVFGEMSKKKELEDYCFLIRTSGTPAYKIVMHRGGKETVITDWTSASQIRSGTSPNQIEVRTSGTQMALYINGQYVATAEADSGYAVGLAGFYTSGSEEVAFDDLQIFK